MGINRKGSIKSDKLGRIITLTGKGVVVWRHRKVESPSSDVALLQLPSTLSANLPVNALQERERAER